MLNSSDLPTDAIVLEQDAQSFLDQFEAPEEFVDVIIILGQLDPIEINLRNGFPRWTEAQRELIIKANDLVREWS